MEDIRSGLFWLVVIVAIAAAYYFGGFDYLKAQYQEGFGAHTTEISYEDFLKELEKTCPYYEPNGARYLECLSELLAERTKEVADQYGQLVNELDANTDPEFRTARETFKQDLINLSLDWTGYNTYLCRAVADRYWGGSDQGGEFSRCRLYQTEKYRLLLESFREEWITNPASPS